MQPLDLSVNKAIKDSLKSKFQSWYADRITRQLKANADKVIKPVDLRRAIMKPLSAKWLVEVMREIGKQKDVMMNGFHKAGIVDAVKTCNKYISTANSLLHNCMNMYIFSQSSITTVRGMIKLPSTGVRTPIRQTIRTRTYARA